jgi:uncharacterized protein YhfF
MTGKADLYWQQYLASLPVADRTRSYVESFGFGFTADDASEIAVLVLDGIKTATGSVLWSYEADGKPIPRVGDHWVVMDGAGHPRCVIRTTDVAIIPFDEVPETYAQEGGEEDLTMATWRPLYWRYIVSECQRLGRAPDPKAPLVMERFTVVYRETLREP